MSQPRSRATEQVRTASAAVLACALVVLIPLTGSALTTAESVAVSLLALAVAGAFAGAIALRCTTLLPHVVVHAATGGDGGPPLLRTRPTDPTHHPLAPRAPGLA